MKQLLLLSLTITLYACAGTSEPADDNTAATTEKKAPANASPNEVTLSAEQLKAMNLQVGAATQTPVNDEVKATGTVDVPPQYMASISVAISGIIKSVNVLPGQRVAKGATLATLQSLDYIQMQQDYLQAVSQLTYQQEELQRQKTLVAEDVGARKRLQQAQADFSSNAALVSSLALKLKTLGTSVETLKRGSIASVIRIVTPIAGYVTMSNVHLGQQVAMTDVLFDVMNQEHKHLELTVYENDAFKIKVGQTILINDPKLGAETVRGRTYLVGRALQGEARTITVHGHVDNEAQESRLVPGMFLNARILTGTRQAMTLPEDAVVRTGQTGFVFLPATQPRTYRRVGVKLGVLADGRLEIVPQQPVDLARVIVKGAYLLEAEMTKGAEVE